MSIVPRKKQRVGDVKDEDEDTLRLLDLHHLLGPLIARGPPLCPLEIYPQHWFRPTDCRPYGHTASHLRYQHKPLLHERVAKLCANLPPELFDDILFYVYYNTSEGWRFVGLRRKSKKHDQDLWGDLIRCSLVCRHWANHCRRYIFGGGSLVISSVEDVEIFMEYATQGCPSLVPVHRLIDGLTVEQRYDAPRSFCHILHSICQLWPEFRDECEHRLHLKGPIPANFLRVYLGDPHWGFRSPSVRNPPSLLRYYEYIDMSSIHLPSFSHAIRYARHFRHARGIEFSKVTWDKGGRNPRPSIYRAPVGLFGDDELNVFVVGCTDNWQLCMQAALDNRNSMLHWLSADAQQWVVSLLMSSRDADASFHALNPSCQVINRDPVITDSLATTEVSFRSSWETPKSTIITYRFVWDKRRLVSTHIDHIPGLVVSVEIPKDSDDHHPVNIDAMFSYLERHPMPTVVIFFPVSSEWTLHCTYGALQAYMKPFRPLAFNPQADGRRYLFICGRSEEHPFPEVHGGKYDDTIGIDPVTLAPTGQSWDSNDEAMSELLGIP
ncbi:hypothetical protein BDY19DRAFT_988049 [Irpex rosettiformis]|uniref:Uncharacterized protein n=1 Tax=Irpex rosettiformis TaxID=378272 RepID=A0ACB8UIT9_9APHY|nr:hypothetical protein BDY19DRAFT_988049 [Irpex rosettiformis]